MNKIINKLNCNWIPSIRKRLDDDTKDYMCYSCFKKELDGEILKDTALMWGNGVIDPSSQLENSMCNDCFKMELDGESPKHIGHQWGIGVIDPSSVQSKTNMCNECFKLELDESNFLQDVVSLLSCIQCGFSLEKNTELFSKIPRICNHCYLTVANIKHSCIRCDPTFPMPQDNLFKKTESVASVESPNFFPKINNPKPKGRSKR